MLKEKLSFVLINTHLLHIPLLASTDGQTEWLTEEQINLEEPAKVTQPNQD